MYRQKNNYVLGSGQRLRCFIPDREATHSEQPPLITVAPLSDLSQPPEFLGRPPPPPELAAYRRIPTYPPTQQLYVFACEITIGSGRVSGGQARHFIHT